VSVALIADTVKVLVVDDDDQIRRMLRRVLGRKAGFDIIGDCATGEAAIELTSELGPDLILMDMNMPGMSGAEATRRIKATTPEVRVVALTGQGDDETVGEMIRSGASGYLLKSAGMSELLAALSEIARGHGALAPEVTPMVLEEVVELYKREQERAEALLELDRMKREFMNIVSHELRTPLTGINGSATTLRRRWDQLDDKTKLDLIGMVETQSAKLDRLVRQILTVSGIQRGDVQPQTAVFSLMAAVDDALQMLTPKRRGRDVQVRLAEAQVRGDRGQLAEVARALVENALEFTTGQINVETRSQDGAAVLVVADEGPGVDRQLMEKLMSEPFQQGDSSMTRAVGGLGVGLYIARQVVEAFGGRLDVETSPDTGSTFRIELPLVESGG
jgi:signal transduction histidine kinase